MSRTTREINRITTTIISMSARLLFYALVFFLLYEGVTRGYSLGHEIFAPTAVASAPGSDQEVVIKKGESLTKVAARLEKDGLIQNKLIFVIQSKFYDYDIYPGTYTLNTAMTSKDMLKLIDEKGTEKQAESAAAKESESDATGEIKGGSGSTE